MILCQALDFYCYCYLNVLCVHIWMCGIYVRVPATCAYISMGQRSTLGVECLPLSLSTLFFKRGSLTEHGDHQLASLAGQKSLHLSLIPKQWGTYSNVQLLYRCIGIGILDPMFAEQGLFSLAILQVINVS